jgi:catechol 2,3-dioxygenase-like lactoylglutathione lyase family enzyme
MSSSRTTTLWILTLIPTLHVAIPAVETGIDAPKADEGNRTPDAAEPAAAAPRSVRRVARIALTVDDLDRSVDFFTRVLEFEEVEQSELAGIEHERARGVFGLRLRTARLRLGKEEIELDDYLAPRSEPFPADTRSNDLWFQHIAIVVSDMEAAYRHLRAHGVEHASSGPQRLPLDNPNAGGIEAFYFRDPDGHFLEVIRFPLGKGSPRWQEPGRGLFLGVDHTAIVVKDTETSLGFYTGVLGLRIAGTSENFGTEQEHLNNVFGARLRITALVADEGPGIELLEYLAPRTGRPRPESADPNDILHWQTVVEVGMIEELNDRLRARPTAWVSPGIVETPRDATGHRRSALVSDPDGHAIQFIELGELSP